MQQEVLVVYNIPKKAKRARERKRESQRERERERARVCVCVLCVCALRYVFVRLCLGVVMLRTWGTYMFQPCLSRKL